MLVDSEYSCLSGLFIRTEYAFDCLINNMFLSKMEYYGVSGTPLALVKISSYLT